MNSFVGYNFGVRKILIFVVLVVGLLVYIRLKIPGASLHFVRSPSQAEIEKYSGDAVVPYEGETRVTTPSGGFYSLELPADWEDEEFETQDDQLSVFSSTSPNFLFDKRENVDGSEDAFYKNGGFIVVSVHKGDFEARRGPSSEVVESQERIEVGGITSAEYKLLDEFIAEGELLETRAYKDGISYVIRFGWDPEGYPEGKSVYRKVISSFKFRGGDIGTPGQ